MRLNPLRLALILVAADIISVLAFGTSRFGSLVSDSIQAALEVILIYASIAAIQRSKGLGRYLWSVAGVAFTLLLAGQLLSVAESGFLLGGGKGAPLVPWVASILFSLWFLPLTVSLFLGSDDREDKFDPIILLDLGQALALLFASYFVLFYIPHLADPSATEIPHGSLGGYFSLEAGLAIALLVRGFLTKGSPLRRTWMLFGIFLTVSTMNDGAYYFTSAHNLRSGSWFDLVWSGVLLVPIYAAQSFDPSQRPSADEFKWERRHALSTQVLTLLYPVLILVMATRVTDKWLNLGLIILGFSYCCTGLRLIIGYRRLMSLKDELDYQATHDQLTGAWNRSAVEGILRRELLRAERSRSRVGVIMIDADWFKQVNDAHGHEAGDKVLRSVVRSVSSTVRAYDYVGRYGGDEFIVIVPSCSASGCRDLAERVRNEVESTPVSLADSDVTVTVSLGMAVSDGRQDWDALILAADHALYAAKKIGRNRVEVANVFLAIAESARMS